MRILVVGGEYAYGAIYPLAVAGLRANGAEADGLGYRSHAFSRPRWTHLPRWLRLNRIAPPAYRALEGVMERAGNRRHGASNRSRLLAALDRVSYDALLVIKGEMIDRALLRDARRLRPGLVTAIWFLDHPLTEWTTPPRPWPGLADALPEYDLAACFDDHYLDELRPLTGAELLHLPLAYDESMFHPLPGAVKRYPASIVGSGFPSRVELLREFPDVARFGPGWPRTLPALQGGALAPAAVNRLYNETMINLNQNHPQSVRDYNNKLFEITGSGGFLLTDAKPNLGRYFAVGREVESYRDAAELREKLDHYRARPEVVAQIARAGYDRARRDHTYRVRMRTLLERLDNRAPTNERSGPR